MKAFLFALVSSIDFFYRERAPFVVLVFSFLERDYPFVLVFRGQNFSLALLVYDAPVLFQHVHIESLGPCE